MGVVPRGRTAGAGRGKSRRKKGDPAVRDASEAAGHKTSTDSSSGQAESWGLFEPIRPILEPVTSMLKPLWSGNVVILMIGLLLYMAFFRAPVYFIYAVSRYWPTWSQSASALGRLRRNVAP